MMFPQKPKSTEPCNITLKVSPQVAAHWLETNPQNRPIKQSHVDRLARDILNNRWQLSHQGIAFDTSGLLLDGQHRLRAIIKADRPVWLRVFFNEPVENKEVVDVGERRSNLDIMNMTEHHKDVSNRHLATLRAMLAGQSTRFNRMSPGEEDELYTRHVEAVGFAVKHLGFSPDAGVATATTRGVVARAFYSANEDRLIHFCNTLKSGFATNERDYAAVILWQFLVRASKFGQADSIRRQRYAKTEWALAAFLAGSAPKQLRSLEVEIFPLPEEVGMS